VHLGTAEVLARAVQTPAIAPGQRGVARLVLETPVVARGGDRFVLRSFSPVTTIGGGVVLDPFAPPRTRLRRRRLALEQAPAARLAVLAVEAGLMGLATDTLAVRLGVSPGRVTAVIAEAGETVLTSAETVVDRQAVVAEASRLAEVVRRHHEEHPLDPGMSLQALRAAVGTPGPPSAVTDAVLEFAVKRGLLEVAGSVARQPRWRPALDARATDASEKLARRLAAARWQVPTVAELEREFPGFPVRALLSHFARTGTAEPIDAERYAAKGALAEFRAALEAALTELGSATPAELRDRFGLTRKYLIPLLEWADRRGVTRRAGDARVLARLTAGKDGS
jgi:selenocysteine-specific elongation factor